MNFFILSVIFLVKKYGITKLLVPEKFCQFKGYTDTTIRPLFESFEKYL